MSQSSIKMTIRNNKEAFILFSTTNSMNLFSFAAVENILFSNEHISFPFSDNTSSTSSNWKSFRVFLLGGTLALLRDYIVNMESSPFRLSLNMYWIYSRIFLQKTVESTSSGEDVIYSSLYSTTFAVYKFRYV